MLSVFEEDIIPHIFETDVVLIPMGINNAFNSGFAKDVLLNFNGIKSVEGNLTGYGDKRKYGTVVETNEGGVNFSFCYMKKGGYRGGDSVDYAALESCLETVRKRYAKKRVCTPLLGYGKFDGNGDRGRILDLFMKAFSTTDIDVRVYVFEGSDRKLEFFKEIAEARRMLKEKEITADEYVKRRSHIEWRRKHGIYSEMPDDYVYSPKSSRKTERINVKKNDFEKTAK